LAAAVRDSFSSVWPGPPVALEGRRSGAAFAPAAGFFFFAVASVTVTLPAEARLRMTVDFFGPTMSTISL
jgi:hypothetical protein